MDATGWELMGRVAVDLRSCIWASHRQEQDGPLVQQGSSYIVSVQEGPVVSQGGQGQTRAWERITARKVPNCV